MKLASSAKRFLLETATNPARANATTTPPIDAPTVTTTSEELACGFDRAVEPMVGGELVGELVGLENVGEVLGCGSVGVGDGKTVGMFVGSRVVGGVGERVPIIGD